jgi:hypothetical protein
MSLLPRTTLHSDSEQVVLFITFTAQNRNIRLLNIHIDQLGTCEQKRKFFFSRKLYKTPHDQQDQGAPRMQVHEGHPESLYLAWCDSLIL